MSSKTLNIIYDTNYMSVIPGWGFVDNQFTWKKTGFFNLLFGDLNKKSEDSKNNNNLDSNPSDQGNISQEQTISQTNSQENRQKGQESKQEKSPWFFDLLFGDLSSWNKNTSKSDNSEIQLSDTDKRTQLQNNGTSQIVNTQPATSVQLPTNAEGTNDNLVNSSRETNKDTTPLNVTGEVGQKKKNWIDSMLDNIFWPNDENKKDEKKLDKNSKKNNISENEPKQEKQQTEQERKANELRDQIKKILEIPDSEYKDSMLTSDMRRFIKKVDEEYTANISDFKSHIAPSYWEYKSNLMNVSGILWKTYYTQRYPTYIDALWTRDLMSMHAKRDMSFFIYPEDDAAMQAMLKRKSTQIKAELNEAMSKWITTDKEVEQQYRDVELIREKLSTREERYFELSNYFTIYNTDENTLKEDWKKFEQKISGYWISVKTANHRMDEWMTSTLPLCIDDLWISRSAVTSSLAWSFPFISNDLVQNSWIFYWLNLHTGWLIIMDRFNDKLPNMNSVILATSWAWKSFTVKLEILRYLLNWIDIIVIDPENEYKELCEAVGWTYINIATNAQQYINPFDLPPRIEDVEYWKWDLLRSQIMTLIWLIEILVW